MLTIEEKIRQFKKFVHEPHGKAVPRGVARAWQVMLKYLQDRAKEEAAVNKKKKVLKKKLATVRGAIRQSTKTTTSAPL